MKTKTTKGLRKSITKMTIAFLCVFTGMNTYGQLYEVPLEQKMEEAELVVEGEIIESECFRTNAGDIYTAHKLKIYKSFKASPPSEYVSIVTRGGILDDEEQTWTHLLTLNVGAKGIFFLHTTSSPPYTLEKVTDNYYSVFSSEQGFLKYDWENEMLRAYEPFHQYKNVEKDIFNRLQKEYGKSYLRLVDNNWSYTEKKDEVIQSYTTQVKHGDKCLDFLFEVMSPDPNNIFQVTTVVSIKATELTHITRPVIALKYSASALGANIVANDKITLEQIGLSDDINYTSVAQDIAPDKARIDVQANSLDEPDLFVITDTYTTLIKIHLTLPGPLDPGLLLDQEMMETLSKYFDLEEGIEKYFDCMRIEGDFSTFQCPIAVISGFNATSLSDTTIVFPADSMRAGTNDVLIISGVCFGINQGDSYVEFTNAKRGPNQGEWVAPIKSTDGNDDYVLWSDTEIRVIVPSKGMDITPLDSVDNSYWYAGTGKIRVHIDGVSQSTSIDTLHVRYAVRNCYADTLQGVSPNHTLLTELFDRNTEGGYDLYYAENFINSDSVPNAETAFESALLEWRCRTNVNFVIKDSIDIDTAYFSRACRISFASLEVGTTTTLASMSPTLFDCTSGGVKVESRLNRFKLYFNSNLSWYTDESMDTTLETGHYDLMSRALHELGHAQGLLHSNNPNDLMYYTDIIAPTDFRRDILDNDEDGASFVVGQSIVTPLGCTSLAPDPYIPMQLYLLDDCTGIVDGINEISNYHELVSVYPNPSNGIFVIRFEDQTKVNHFLTVFNVVGEYVYSQKLNKAETNIDIHSLSKGMYILNVVTENQFIQSFRIVIE